MAKQHAVIVGHINPSLGSHEKQIGIEEVNKLLGEGWQVGSVHQLSALAATGSSTSISAMLGCLVILEKPED